MQEQINYHATNNKAEITNIHENYSLISACKQNQEYIERMITGVKDQQKLTDEEND